jgi:autotransporter-associated beta strand protein
VDADHGEHLQITFKQAVVKPGAEIGKGYLYTKTVAAKAELHWEDETGAEVQMTSVGKLSISNAITTGFTVAGPYIVSFPVNNMDTAKFMLGDASTIAWFYLNVAPPGWKVITTGGDTVLGISGGDNSYDVNGGNPDDSGTWIISGLEHTHTGTTQTESGLDPNLSSGGDHSHTHNFTTNSAGASDGTWRPKASVGKLFQLDGPEE